MPKATLSVQVRRQGAHVKTSVCEELGWELHRPTLASTIQLDSPAVTVRLAVLLMEPYWLEAVQENWPPSSGKASAITKVQISSEKESTPTKLFMILQVIFVWVELNDLMLPLHSSLHRCNVWGTLFVMRCDRDIWWTGRHVMCMVHWRWTGNLDWWITAHSQTDRVHVMVYGQTCTQTNTGAQMFRDVWVTHSLEVTPEMTTESHRWETVWHKLASVSLFTCDVLCMLMYRILRVVRFVSQRLRLTECPLRHRLSKLGFAVAQACSW